jgi:hypothetical protein
MLRGDNIKTAMWANDVIRRHVIPEPPKHV